MSNNTKDFVPRIAAALGVSPVTDICEVLNEDTFVRPFYAGNALATVKTKQPVTVATVRATAFEKVEAEGGAAGVESASIGIYGDLVGNITNTGNIFASGRDGVGIFVGGSVLDNIFILIGKCIWFLIKYTLYVLSAVVIMAVLLDGGYLG